MSRHRIRSTKMNPNVNYGLQVIMMCPSMWVYQHRGRLGVLVYGKSLYLSLNFSVKLKLFLTYKVLNF